MTSAKRDIGDTRFTLVAWAFGQMATSGLGVVSVVSCRLPSCRKKIRIASTLYVRSFEVTRSVPVS